MGEKATRPGSEGLRPEPASSPGQVGWLWSPAVGPREEGQAGAGGEQGSKVSLGALLDSRCLAAALPIYVQPLWFTTTHH